jgi:hypothetical protein
MHHWILDNPFDDPPEHRIATIIAKWWPGHYLLVSTIALGGSDTQKTQRGEPAGISTAERFISALQTGVGDLKNAPPLPETFVTQVVRCNKYGIARSWNNPLFESEYATLEEAKIGHKEAVARFR